jgi:hypothetical protein
VKAKISPKKLPPSFVDVSANDKTEKLPMAVFGGRIPGGLGRRGFLRSEGSFLRKIWKTFLNFFLQKILYSKVFEAYLIIVFQG